MRRYKDTISHNRHCYSVPLRLRGGGDGDDDEQNVKMTDAASTSGDMGANGSNKRGPPSPVDHVAKQQKSSKHPGELSDLIGWLEQTAYQKKEKKKLGIQVAEKIISNLSRVRTLTQTIINENSRLAGDLKGKHDALVESIKVFINKLDAKNVETNNLKSEIEALKLAKNAAPSVVPPQRPTYANQVTGVSKTATLTVGMVVDKPAKPKPKAAKDKELLAKSRKVKATSRFMVEIPKEMTVAAAKNEVWNTVKAKIRNPRAKTIVSGSALIIIPDDNNTLEVMRSLDKMYDVDSGITKDDLAEGLLIQNPELGLTEDEVRGMTPLHKLGLRNGNVVHWVIKAPPSVITKIENKSVYIGMTRCRVKVHCHSATTANGMGIRPKDVNKRDRLAGTALELLTLERARKRL